MHPSLHCFILGILFVPSFGLPAPYTVASGDRPYVGIIPFRRGHDVRPKASVWHHLGRRTGIKRQDKPVPVTVNMIHMHALDAATPTLAAATNIAAAQAIVPAPTSVAVNTVDEVSHAPESAHVVFNAGEEPTPVAPPQASPTAHSTHAAASPAASPKQEQMEPNAQSAEPGMHMKKVALVACIIGVIFGLLVFVALAKLCKDAVTRRRFSYAARAGSSQNGLIRCRGPSKDEMCQAAKHNVVLTRPDGSEVSQSFSDSTAETDDAGPATPWAGPPPSAAPAYPPPSPPPPTPYMSLLSPTANLLQQNLAAAEKDKDSRASTVSEDFTSTASTSNVSESAQSAQASERGSRLGTHRRMHSAPVSVVSTFGERISVGDRVSAGVDGYWDTLDTYMRPHSTGVGGRMSRTRSMDGAGVSVRFSERM